MQFILSLFGLGEELAGLATDPLRNAYARLVIAFWSTVALINVGLVCNINEWLWVNLILCILFAMVTAILWWRPQQALLVMAVSKVTEGKTGEKTLLTHYALIYRTISLVGTLVFLFLGFIPFKGNLVAFFGLIASTITVTLVTEEWGIAGKFGKKLIFYGVCTIIGACVISVVPLETWGDSSSFLGEWATSIKAKKSGVFVLIALIATILTLFDERSEAKKESKGGYTALIVTLFTLMDILFMPPAVSKMWAEYRSESHDPQPAVQALERPAPKGVQVIPVRAVQGVFTEVKIPPNTAFRWGNQEGCLVAFVADQIPQTEVHDCSEDIELADDLQNLRLGFASKGAPIVVLVTLTPKKL